MDTPPWRDRVRLYDELLEQLQEQVRQAAKQRADALSEGVQELGSVYAVAKDLGKSWTAVSNALKKHHKPATGETTR